MIKTLVIDHLVLVEHAEIHFKPGLNIITGETGAGKSAVMAALKLIIGERADASFLRKGADKGKVEAVIEWSRGSGWETFFEEHGLDFPEEDLIIRREISSQGKSRAFLNHQPVQLALLKQISGSVVKFLGQHAVQQLLDSEFHRQFIDEYADLGELRAEFSLSWKRELKIREELEGLRQKEAEQLRELDRCRKELEEIDEVHPQEGEEEELFDEFSLHANHEEITSKGDSLLQLLLESESSIVAMLKKERAGFEKLREISKELEEPYALYSQAVCELEEAAYEIQKFLGSMEYNSERKQIVEERLSAIHTLKRKYGPEILQVLDYREKTSQRLRQLENRDETIESLANELNAVQEENDRLAKELSDQRKTAAKSFEKEIVMALKELNFPKVSFQVKLERQKRSVLGDDHVEFFFSPNIGENEVSIKECASGGELSRILLAVESLLAGKRGLSSIVFDEIDANIGGETALLVGDKLHQIGKAMQVVSITHFPQVAMKADHHLKISKEEKEGRTLTTIHELGSAGRIQEIERMQGGKAASRTLGSSRTY